MPPAETLIGKCKRGSYYVCTFRANFHIFLGNLGKTNITNDRNEYELVSPQFWHSMDPLLYDNVPNHPARHRRVFLYEVSQLTESHDHNRTDTFRLDLQHYLGLSRAIPPMIWFKPGRNHTDELILQRTASRKIDICDERYQQLRAVLLEQAVNASRWIRRYFVKSPDVYVSSPDFFASTLMPSWERDPCLDRKVKMSG
jgi:hypothetical protein